MNKTEMISLIIMSMLICTTPLVAQERKAINNPAMVYCSEMGYQYETRFDQNGNEYGVCVFTDNTECDAWDFYKGKSGKSFSYCAQNGYDTEASKSDEGTYQTECAECVFYSDFEDNNSSGSPSVKGFGKQKRIKMLDLMAENEEKFLDKLSVKKRFESESVKKSGPDPSFQYFDKVAKNLPTAFDWRNLNGHSYIGPVRDQGDCGSCYSFGALASAEGVYNFATGNYDGNCADFSESYLMWCLGKKTGYRDHFYGCNGADWDYMELTALTVEGAHWESTFPYTTTDPKGCPIGDDTPVTFSGWGRIPCEDIEAMKTAISTYGAIDVAVYASSNWSNYKSGIYTDANTACNYDTCYSNNGTNHAVSLVGWGHDDVVGDYWILRNSWGASWGENGYMRIGVKSARVSCEATYLTYGEGPPAANFSAAQTTVCAGSTVAFNDMSIGDPVSWEWSFTPETATFINGTNKNSENPAVQFEEGVYTVTLQVGNANGSDTMTKSEYISVISGQTVRLEMVFDEYPQETSWALDGVNLSEGPFSAGQQTYSTDFCLPEGSYTFSVYDLYGDGMCCSYGYGHYSLKNLTTGEIIVDSLGIFTDVETTEFCIGCPICQTAANREHQNEGRAYYDYSGAEGKGYYAVGSDQFLGQSGKMIQQLKEDPRGSFLEGRCENFPIHTSDNNRNHKKAGRCYRGSGANGYGYYAVGSNDFLGESGRTVTELVETSLNYYVREG